MRGWLTVLIVMSVVFAPLGAMSAPDAFENAQQLAQGMQFLGWAGYGYDSQSTQEGSSSFGVEARYPIGANIGNSPFLSMMVVYLALSSVGFDDTSGTAASIGAQSELKFENLRFANNVKWTIACVYGLGLGLNSIDGFETRTPEHYDLVQRGLPSNSIDKDSFLTVDLRFGALVRHVNSRLIMEALLVSSVATKQTETDGRVRTGARIGVGAGF